MEVNKNITIEIIKTNIVNDWIKILDKDLLTKINSNKTLKKIVIIYEPVIANIDFYSLFNIPYGGINPISIDDYIKRKLKRNNLTNYSPRVEYIKDPIGLEQELFRIYVKFHKYNEYEIELYNEWERIVNKDGYIIEQISIMIRNKKTSCILHTDRNSITVIDHSKIFSRHIIKGHLSIEEYIVKKFDCLSLKYYPFSEYINDPLGLNTLVFRFGVTVHSKKASPRFNDKIKMS